jgi:hypothetical protein
MKRQWQLISEQAGKERGDLQALSLGRQEQLGLASCYLVRAERSKAGIAFMYHDP